MSTPQPLHYGCTYHIFNRGVNRGTLFFEPRNYAYFMQLYTRYITPIADTYAYCLLGNHFHFLIRLKEIEEILGEHKKLAEKPASQHFSNLFNAYARTINMTYQRTGALFQRPFGRILITDNAHFTQLIVYIHRNPQKHGLVDDFHDWPYSSYGILFQERPTRLMRAEVVDLFGGSQGIESAHGQPPDDNQIAALVADDET